MSRYIVIFILALVSLVTSQGNSHYASNPKNKFTFQGLMAPVFTPFNNDVNQTLNLNIIPEYAKFLASKNITGVLVGGTTGEGTSLSVAERKKLVEAWADAVKETKQHLMVQIGGVALVDVKELASHAENLYVDSLLTLPDLYFKPSKTEELIEYLSSISKYAPNTPLIYYQSTKAAVPIKTGDLLKNVGDKVPTLAGVKLDSSDIKDGVSALDASNDKFKVIYGSKMVMSAGCAIGVDTFMSATLSFFPEPSIKLLDFCRGDASLKSGQQHQSVINRIEKGILKHGGYVEAMKTAMSLTTNLFMGPPRAPLRPLSQENIAALKKELSNINL